MRTHTDIAVAVLVVLFSLSTPPPLMAQDCDLACQIERFITGILQSIIDDEMEDPTESTGRASTRLERRGVFFTPTRTNPEMGIDFNVPTGTYRRLRLDLTVRHGGWLERQPNARFNIFWLARDRNRDLIGYTAIQDKRRLFVRHGIGQRQPDKARLQTRTRLEPGRSYRFEYLYDTSARRVELTVTTGGERVAQLVGQPNVDRLRIGARQDLVIGFSFDGRHNPKEQPNLGWQYRDLLIELE